MSNPPMTAEEQAVQDQPDQQEVPSSPAPSQEPSVEEISTKIEQLIGRYGSVMRQNGRVVALDSRSIWHEEEEVDDEMVLAELIAAIQSALQSQTARAERAEAALKEATTPDMYGIDDMVVDSDDLYSLELDVGTVAKVWANRSLGDRWIACFYSPDSDEYEYAVFDTEADARAALESSTPSPSGANQ